MNTQFKAKLLQTLANKKANKGFTLIELLVVVIIIGVLAAIALPNLLGQVGKARESEAKSQVGAVNRAQQVYYTEFSTFAPGSGELEMPLPAGKYYEFAIDDTNLGVVTATNANNDQDNTRDYIGGTSYNTEGRVFATAVCRVDEDVAAAVGTHIANSGISDTANIACAGTSTAIR